MGKPITREFDQSKGILKFFDYKGAHCVVSDSGVVADDNGNKIVPAGTPYPEAGANCLGFLLHDVDVTQGSAPGTYIYEGTIDPNKVAEGLITSDSLAAVPKVNLFGSSYKASATPVTGVTLNKSTATITGTGTEQLTATIAPANATIKTVSWTSSDSTKATVDGTGKVTGVASGTATITVTTLDGGYTATCTVTVS